MAASMSTSLNFWEDLRNLAGQLESELELKLVSFNTLCESFNDLPWTNNSGNLDHSFDYLLSTMSSELEELLAKLTALNDKMAECSVQLGTRPTSLAKSLAVTLEQHREVLLDYGMDFQQIKRELMSLRRRISKDRARKNIHNAVGTNEAARFQRGILKSIKTRLTDMRHRFPVINRILQNLNLRKKRNMCIIGAVIGMSVVLMLFNFN